VMRFQFVFIWFPVITFRSSLTRMTTEENEIYALVRTLRCPVVETSSSQLGELNSCVSGFTFNEGIYFHTFSVLKKFVNVQNNNNNNRLYWDS
jgi:hypothetical protein